MDPQLEAAWIGLAAAALGLFTALVSIPAVRQLPRSVWRRLFVRNASGGMPAWAGTDTDDGVLYTNAEKTQILVVLVHGVLGGPISTWGRLADLLHAAVETPVDLLSFQYPAGFFTKASISQGAAYLTEVLRFRAKPYNQLIFVAHSTGGLVVKQALTEEMERVAEEASSMTDASPLVDESFALRSRQVLNFAVPHAGGSLTASLLLIPTYGFVIFPALILGRFLPKRWLFPQKKGFERGLNRIGLELRWQRGGLKKLEERFAKIVTEFDRRRLPRPSTCEVLGRQDNVIDKIVNDTTGRDAHEFRLKQDQTLLFRGSHPGIKEATRVEDPAIQYIAGFVRRYQNRLGSSFADRAIRQSLLLDGATELVGSAEVDRPDFNSVLSNQQEGVQSAILRELTAYAKPDRGKPKLIVLTGDTGTGKSRVLRTFARSLGNGYLNGVNEPRPLPVFMPLDRFNTKDNQAWAAAKDLPVWDRLVLAWLEWYSQLTKTTVTKEGFLPQLTEEPTVLVMDSLDELLMNNRDIKRDSVRSMIFDLRRRYEDHRLCIVIGVRWGDPILDALSAEADRVYQISELTIDLAITHFPAAKPVIDRVCDLREQLTRSNRNGERDPSSRNQLDLTLQWLLTPLILSDLVKDKNLACDVSARDLRYEHQVTEFALEVNIKHTELTMLTDEDGALWNISDWKTALAVVSMIYSEGHQIQMNRDQIVEGVARIEGFWSQHRWSDEQSEDRRCLARAFKLIRSETTQNPLLNNTVFRTDQTGKYRFKHLEWHDFLLGYYFAFSFRNFAVAEITRTSFNIRAHRIGGQILDAEGKFRVTEALADNALREIRGRRGQFVAGNLGALLGKSIIPFDPGALDKLFEDENQAAIPGGGKLVLLAGLGYRVLRNQPNDRSKFEIRGKLIHAFRKILDQWHAASDADRQAMHGQDRVLASVAYCYMCAFCSLNPDEAWPGLNVNERQEREVVNRLHNEWSGQCFLAEEVLDPVYKTCQTAFYQVLIEELDHPGRPISLVHYMYTLAVTVKQKGAIRLVWDGLPDLLTDPRVEMRFSQTNLVPEVARVFRVCSGLLSRDRMHPGIVGASD